MNSDSANPTPASGAEPSLGKKAGARKTSGASGQSEFSIEWLEGALEWILAQYIRGGERRVMLVCPAQPQTELVGERLRALLGGACDIRIVPDVEYLPYDHYSPAQESVAARLKALAEIAEGGPSLVLTSPANILHRLPPRSRLDAYTMHCSVGSDFARQRWAEFLTGNAYYASEQADEPGSFSVRGDIIDVYAHGSEQPWRIDTLDDEVVSIRPFDPATGEQGDELASIDLIPGALVPLDDEALARFQEGFCALGPHAVDSALYSAVSGHRLAQGIESYFPLFYESTQSLPELLGGGLTTMLMPGVRHTLEHYLDFSLHRYEDGRNNPERPLLAPSRLLLSRPELKTWLKSDAVMDLDNINKQRQLRRDAGMDLAAAPPLSLSPAPDSDEIGLFDYLSRRQLRCIVCSSSTGRMSYQSALLDERAALPVAQAANIQEAIAAPEQVLITVAPFEHSFIDKGAGIIIVGESVFGSITRPSRHRTVVDELTRQGVLLNSLDQLRAGEPIIHPEHGVGRFGGITRVDVNEGDAEFIRLDYAGGDKLYVPIDQVFLLDRYHLSEGEDSAPWHALGSSQWRKATRKARAGMDDLATRIIALHAARQKAEGLAHRIDPVAYQDFCAQFPYQETPDQRKAIQEIVQEMRGGAIIDRLVVGEVGCGKTEVAMRAVFICVSNRRQAVVLAPTTVLAQQHFERFRERMAQWEINVAIMSRFNKPEHARLRRQLAAGEVDVLIATHAALSDKVRFDNLGLVVIDEEQRFGVAQKEKLRRFAANLNVIKLSATPIPRTLQMALSGLSSISIIATLPPTRRGVRTEVLQWDDERIRSCCERELFRGGQVFVVHPRVRSLGRLRDRLRSLLPDARIAMVHGQNDDHEIEQAMLDFYHHHCDILVTTSIIENGVDFPSANTIIINDATAFGLSSLHQLRGRVGRSHLSAYAYLVVPPEAIHTRAAKQRIETVEQHSDGASGFKLAMADLDMRGAGTPLGGKQSGHEVKIGYSAYMGELARTLSEHGSSLHEIFGIYEPQVVEVSTPAPALLPESYIEPVSDRLRHYRAIYYAGDPASLYELRAQMHERFGPLPPAAENLFAIVGLKQKCQELGACDIELTGSRTRIKFAEHHRLDLDKLLLWAGRHPQRIRVGGGNQLEIRHQKARGEAENDEDFARVAAQIALCGHILDYLSQNNEADGAFALTAPSPDAPGLPEQTDAGDPFMNNELTSRHAL